MTVDKLVFTSKLDLFAYYNLTFLYEISAIKKYIKDTELKVAKDQIRFNEYLNSRLKDVPTDEHGSVYAELEELDMQHNRFLPNLLFNSVCISLDSFVEVNLFSICNQSNNYFMPVIKPSELRRKGIVTLINYLEKEIGLQLKSRESLVDILFYHNVRNILIHGGGWFTKDKLKQGFEKQIEDKEGIEINIHQEYINITSSKFLFHYIDTIQNLFSEITHGINEMALSKSIA